MYFIKLTSLILMVFTLQSCKCQQKASKINDESLQTGGDYIIEYLTSSRGIYNQIIINKKTISSLKTRGGSPSLHPIGGKNWNTITKMLERIEVENISTLKAPSKAFLYDGAAIAHLKITKGDKTYESAPFDHGNPPKEIAELVKVILSISENIE